MILLKIFYFLIISKIIYLVYCTPVINKNIYSEFEERISKLQVQNFKLVFENAKLKFEIIQSRLENEITATYTNCTSIADGTAKFSVQTRWEDVQSFKKYFDKMLESFAKNDLNPESTPDEIEIKEMSWPKNCIEAANGKSGVYTIELPNSGLEPFPVVCDAETQYGGWTIVQQRINGHVNFHRSWSAYKSGFGTITENDEFFIGLEKLHKLTSSVPHELFVILVDFNNVTKYANYDNFVIGSKDEKYSLKVLGNYIGTAGDSLYYHKEQQFSTFDEENNKNCAQHHKGGWWYRNCVDSNLNGLYYSEGINPRNNDSLLWYGFHGNYKPLKESKMMIRPKWLMEFVKK